MPEVPVYKLKNMISNPNRYKTKRSPVLLIEEKLNNIYEHILELKKHYDLNDEVLYDLENIQTILQDIHGYFTDTLKDIAIKNKKYYLND